MAHLCHHLSLLKKKLLHYRIRHVLRIDHFDHDDRPQVRVDRLVSGAHRSLSKHVWRAVRSRQNLKLIELKGIRHELLASTILEFGVRF